MTLAEIATEVGLSTSSVGDLASGRSSSPRGEAAMRLHDLHKTRCKATKRKGRAEAVQHG